MDMDINTLNTLPAAELADALTKCCGSTHWVGLMVDSRPYASEADLLEKAYTAWAQCSEADGREAFTHHPRIGGMEELAQKFASTSAWASGEQSSVKHASSETLQALADGNHAYEARFGYIFIVCATGKSADEMLALLQARLPNPPEKEIGIAMAEQMKITVIRLQKLLAA
jgi:2-oxo-4-hydroxy-4-carboxy-5-ureidoimidazoline decarboxylase